MTVTQSEEQMINRSENMVRLFLFLYFILGITAVSNAQETDGILEGAVSYITGKNIYVKFESTSGIENGDTLFIKQNNILTPALIVQHQSSISCLCNPVGRRLFKVGDPVFAHRKNKEISSSPILKNEEQVPEKDVSEEVLTSAAKEPKKAELQSNVSGRLSLSSYSNFSNAGSRDLHRFRYTLSLDANHISNSILSAETYISFTHKLHEWDVVQQNLNDALKIYDLALRYDFSEAITLFVGRKINPKIANVGAIDGLQFQYGFKKMFVGIAAGSRPDYFDYGYNFDLFEYGAYFGQSQKVKNGFVQTTLAFFEQRNKGNIDRRFVYFQHTNSILKNLNLFSSFELDLYKLENGQPKNTLSLTSLYLSLRYRVSRRMSVFGSYDNRKNVIYYETFRNYADELLQQASRQGLRFRVNYRPVNYLILGVNAGTRFMKGDPQRTKTLNSTATYSRIPGINASLSLSANLLQTAYLNGQIYGARLSKDIIPGKFYGTLNYRHVDFKYASTSTSLKQHIGEIDLSYQLNKKWYFSVNFEATLQESENYNRLYLNLRRKF